MEIGIIGLGAMGRAIARNLAAAGHAVKAWNRSGGDVAGVRMVETPAQALQADVALTMLSDDAATRSVLLETGALAQARRGLVHIVASTISVAFARELVECHRTVKIGYVAAPVLGRPDVASKGELQMLAAGQPAALDTVRPVLEVIGKRVWDMGAEPPTAYAAKIACNMMITMAIEAMAEAVVLTESHGLVRERFFDLILAYPVRQSFIPGVFGQYHARALRAGIQGIAGLEGFAACACGGGTAGAAAADARCGSSADGRGGQCRRC